MSEEDIARPLSYPTHFINAAKRLCELQIIIVNEEAYSTTIHLTDTILQNHAHGKPTRHQQVHVSGWMRKCGLGVALSSESRLGPRPQYCPHARCRSSTTAGLLNTVCSEAVDTWLATPQNSRPGGLQGGGLEKEPVRPLSVHCISFT